MNTNHNRQDAFPLRIFTAAAVFLAAAILLSCGSVPETTDTAVYDDSLTGLLSSGKIDELKRRLGIDVGETTPDGKFSLDCLRCVGACGLAPVIMIGEKVYGRLQAADIKNILDELE